MQVSLNKTLLRQDVLRAVEKFSGVSLVTTDTIYTYLKKSETQYRVVKERVINTVDALLREDVLVEEKNRYGYTALRTAKKEVLKEHKV